MDRQTLSSHDSKMEHLLAQSGSNPVQRFVSKQAQTRVESLSASPSSYDLYVVRKNPQAGGEIFGPARIHVGTYSTDELYGPTGSRLQQFRDAISALARHAATIVQLDGDSLEWAHQCTLFWVELGTLRTFLGTSATLSEIIAELRTARFQYLGKDTPVTAMKAMANALGLLVDAPRWDGALVDRFIDILESGGFDSLAPEALRADDA